MEKLAEWIDLARLEAKKGKLPTYIPELAQKKPEEFAFYYLGAEGEKYLGGDVTLRFPLMSVIKPFILLYLLNHLGTDKLFQKVGRQPSDYPFNSLEQLQLDQGFPRNPMINSGAICLGGLIDNPEKLSQWLQLELDRIMLASVKSLTNHRNLALAQEMTSRGYLENPQLALDNYNYLCCLSGTVLDIARLGLMLLTSPSPLSPEHCQITQGIMTTCGLYEASKFGFPTKSGVSGLILSLFPPAGVMVSYSPPLNPDGNSTAGFFLLTKLALASD